MRTLHGHETNETNKSIRLTADDRDPHNGNASHRYLADYRDSKFMVMNEHIVSFQHGPIAEVGVNGITHEVLLTIVIDRLDGFQSGKYACTENAVALAACREALASLESRTTKRIERGVEGTHNV